MDSVPHRTLYRSAILNPDDPLFVIPGDSVDDEVVIDYATAWNITLQYRDWILQLAQQILADCNSENGIDREVVVAFLSPNTPQYLLSILGSMVINYTSNIKILPALLNARWGARDVYLALDQSCRQVHAMQNHSCSCRTKSIIIISAVGFLEVGRRASDLLNRTGVGSQRHQHAKSVELPTFLKQRENVAYSYFDDFDNRQNAIVLFTSGTTKGSKGVLLSHRSLTVQAMAKLMPPCSFNRSYSMMASTSFFHIGGLSSSLAILIAGGRLVFFPNSSFRMQGVEQLRFRADVVRKYLREGIINILVVVPTMVHLLLEKHFCNEIYPITKLVLVGGQNLSSLQKSQVPIVFPNAAVVQTYACSEAGSSISFAEASKENYKLIGSSSHYGNYVGISPAHIDVNIFDPKVTHELRKLPVGSIGIIGTRGCHIMNGYWPTKHREESDRTLFRGWLRTGDLGFIDKKGHLFYCGRASDTIRTGGETVFATEVEEAVNSSPIIEECAAFPLPDERFGEIVCVAIVLNDPNELSVSQILSHVRGQCVKQNLARYKLPKLAFICQRLPRNSNGKVQKHEVIKSVAEANKIARLSKM